MSINGSGIRDIARVLEISPATVINEIKKTKSLQQVNKPLLARMNCSQTAVEICCVNIAEIDFWQSFVGKKANPRWLWHAIDHDTGEVLAYTLGTREDKVFLELKQLLAPFGITRFCTDK
jgi:hypothetical protein